MSGDFLTVVDKKASSEDIDLTWWSPLSSSSAVDLVERRKGLVKLLVGGSSGNQQTLTCDKRRLTSNSTYFAKRIVRDMDSDLPEWVVLPNGDPAALDIILKFLTNEQFPSTLSLELTLRVLEAAEEYGMDEVAQHFRNHVKNIVKGVNDAVDILGHANRLRDDELIRLAMNYLVPRFSILITSKAFLNLSRTSICSLLKNKDVVVKSENLIFEAVIKWAESECKKLHIDFPNYQELRGVLGNILNLIRFPTMKAEYFRNTVLPTGLLPSEDCQLLEYYWKLLETDSVAAAAMSLPFEKSKRTGSCYSVTFFPRKASNKMWQIPAQQWMTIKLRSECSIKLHNLLLYATSEKCQRSTPAKIILMGKVGSNESEGSYHIENEQDAVVRLTHHDGSRLELDPSVTISAGRKYQLRVLFIQTLRDSSEGSLRGSGWMSASANCGNENFRLLTKKERGGDFLFHSLDFSLAPSYNKEKDTFSIPREDIGHHLQHIRKDVSHCGIS